jgi:WD40 repeat protein
MRLSSPNFTLTLFLIRFAHRSIAAADAKGIVSVFDIGEGRKVSELPASDSDPYIYSLMYSPCSSALATGSKGGIKIYDVRGEERKVIKEVSLWRVSGYRQGPYLSILTFPSPFVLTSLTQR